MKKKYDETNKKNNYFRPQCCRNCGLNGHLYKDCPHPIMSFGIICYKIINNEIKYIMIQRKDSLSFMEFVRGKYNIEDDKYIIKLIEYMTDSEKKLLLTNSFEQIWNYTWCQINQGTFKHTKEYIDSKNKFEIIMNDSNIKNLLSIKNVNNNNESEQEWGFPKGRKKLKESDIDCAIREFCEETQLDKNDIEINKNIIPFQEIFFGTNNILYKHVYYIAKIVNDDAEIQLDNTCIEQIREIRSLKWFSNEEVLNHIKNHNTERIKIFKKAHSVINNNKSLM
jgi:8-oxo-dGTP pyrophosphatase MutT (NUDIX family)